MSDHEKTQPQLSPSDVRLRRVTALCFEFDNAWEAGDHPQIEDYLQRAEPADLALALQQLVAAEVANRRQDGEEVVADEYRDRFRDRADLIDAAFALVGLSTGSQPFDSTVSIRNARVESDGPDRPAVPAPQSTELPESLGPFKIVRELGRGTFGVVYQAYDPGLDRAVALKVPHTERIGSAADLAQYKEEAQNAAKLDRHPGIVRVHQLQQEGDRLVIVQEFIDGCNLAEYLKANAASTERIVELVTAIAEALGHAHECRLFHRDLKPANILIDQEGHPHIADFGLALRESVQR